MSSKMVGVVRDLTGTLVVEKGGPGSGWFGPPKGTHVGRGVAGVGITTLHGVVPRSNLRNLKLKQSGSLVHAYDKRADTHAYRYMYDPKTGELLAGGVAHATLHSWYGRGKYDDYVKMESSYMKAVAGEAPDINIFLDRHQAVSDAEAWDMAFAAAKAMKRAGFPGNTELTFDYWTQDKPSITIDMETL